MDFNNYEIKQNLGDLIDEMLPFNSLEKPILKIEYEGQTYQIQIVITSIEHMFLDEE